MCHRGYLNFLREGGNRGQGAGGREQGAGGREQEAGGREQGAGCNLRSASK